MHKPAAAAHERPPQDLASMHTQPQPNPQSTSPVRLIENHQNGKGVLGQTKKTRAREKSKNPSPGLSPRDLHELT